MSKYKGKVHVMVHRGKENI